MFKNSLTMIGDIERCYLFTFKDQIDACARYLPAPLVPVNFGGFAYWNIVVCKLHDMRPKLSPFKLGFSYWHIAYRIYACFETRAGEHIEGLFFVRSDCDNSVMAYAGNIMTDFRLHVGRVRRRPEEPDYEVIEIACAGSNAAIKLSTEYPQTLSDGSPFKSLEEAQSALKYKPNGLSADNGKVNVMHVSRDESKWKSRLVTPHAMTWEFMQTAAPNCEFEICYDVEPISYQWNSATIYDAADKK